MKINSISKDYPVYLQMTQTIAKAPKRLWYIGNLPNERIATVAVIGTRKPTTYGREVTYRLAGELASRGVVVVSGLALGIDAIAHRAALEARGTTIAIMPCGLDNIHPRSHRQLAIDIIKSGGALITEYPTGTAPYPSHFIARNRIVSGISDGILVVEATLKSGTVHTAGFALEQGKPVMAVPGNITSQFSEGCNNLIKTGACAVTKVEDILYELGINTKATQQTLPFAGTAEETALLQLMHKGMRDGAELQIASKLPADVFAQTLTMLEITGKVRSLGANQWAIK